MYPGNTINASVSGEEQEPSAVAGAPPQLSVQVAASLEALRELAPQYERLHLATANTSPFALHEWHEAWSGHFLNLDPRVRDELMVLAMHNATGECVAIVPLVASRRRLGPLNIVSIDLLGGDPSTTELRTPLIQPGYESAAAAATRRLLAGRRDWDWIYWTSLAGAFGEALAAEARIDIEPEPPGYVLDLLPTWEAFRGQLKENVRNALRHCYNSLKREGHSFSVEVAVEPAAVRAALDRFLELHTLRANSADMAEHPNYFSTEVSRRFLYAVCDRLAARGAARIFQLRIGTEIVAVRIAFVVGDSLYLYFSGFDPRWGRFSVMTTTVAEALKYAIAAGLKTVNLSRGTDTSKTRWRPRAIVYTGGFERRARMRSIIALHLYRGARSGRGLSGLLSRMLKARRAWN